MCGGLQTVLCLDTGDHLLAKPSVLLAASFLVLCLGRTGFLLLFSFLFVCTCGCFWVASFTDPTLGHRRPQDAQTAYSGALSQVLRSPSCLPSSLCLSRSSCVSIIHAGLLAVPGWRNSTKHIYFTFAEWQSQFPGLSSLHSVPGPSYPSPLPISWLHPPERSHFGLLRESHLKKASWLAGG